MRKPRFDVVHHVVLYLPGGTTRTQQGQKEVNAECHSQGCFLLPTVAQTLFCRPCACLLFLGAGLCFMPCPDPPLTFLLLCSFRHKIGLGLRYKKSMCFGLRYLETGRHIFTRDG